MTRNEAGAAQTPAEKIVRALRRGWWIVVGTTALVCLATLLVLFRATPLYEAEGLMRIDPDGPGFRGLEALQGLQVLAGAGAPGVPTEIQAIRSRTRALEADAELGASLRLDRPRGVPRSLLFHELRLDPGLPQAEFRFEAAGEGYRAEARLREVPEVWRPFQRRPWVVVDSARVVPGEPFRLGGLSGRLLENARGRADEIVVGAPMEEDYLRDYERRLEVERPERDADVVRIRFQDADPALARDVVNLLQESYIADRRAHRMQEPLATAEVLVEQLDILRRELSQAEEAFLTFRDQRRVFAPEEEAEGEVLRLIEMMAERDLADAEHRALSGLVDEIRAEAERPDQDGPSPWRRLVAFPTLLEASAAAEQLRMLGELDTQRGALLETRTEEDLRVRVLTERTEALERQLRATVETYLDGLRRQVASLDRTLEGYRDELSRIPEMEMEFVRHRRHLELLSEILTVLETRHREAEIRVLVEDRSVRILDPARLPRAPVRPRPFLSLALSILVGLSLGTVGALVREGV
jgi:uncharacterized protein involved in exopolysaccharide biosynthesis